MHIEKITYRDYNDIEHTDEFMFNLRSSDIVEWLAQSGNYSLDQVMLQLRANGNSREMINIFKDLLRRAYGELSLDGTRFVHGYDNPEVASKFFDSNAYSVLFMQMVSDAAFAGRFFASLIPKDLAEEVQKIMEENPEGVPDEIKEYFPKRSAETATITPISQA